MPIQRSALSKTRLTFRVAGKAASSADRLASESQFARDVRDGLHAPQKMIPAEYLYDSVGSALFDAITLLPEYGLTRAEERLLHSSSDEIAEKVGHLAFVAELGSGSGRKTSILLEAIARRQKNVAYCAIDVSNSALQTCRKQLGNLEGVQVQTLESSYLIGLAKVCRERPALGSLLVLFLGSSIGNFSTDEMKRFLKRVRSELRPGDGILLGADLVKPRSQLLNAYDDPAGVTAAFNLNLLARINRELHGNFRLEAFRHEARWRPEEARIEMHLVSLEHQVVTVEDANCTATFQRGESIWTEACQKFTPEGLHHMARQAGFAPIAQWIDSEWQFAENLWIAV
jgi:dimethylhistidine N-methyltransferase